MRDALEPVEHGGAQLMQARERELHLRLEARGAGDPQIACGPGGVLEQRSLADPGFAADHEHAAVVVAKRVDLHT